MHSKETLLLFCANVNDSGFLAAEIQFSPVPDMLPVHLTTDRTSLQLSEQTSAWIFLAQGGG